MLGSSLNFKSNASSSSLNILESRNHQFQFFEQNSESKNHWLWLFRKLQRTNNFHERIDKKKTDSSLEGYLTFHKNSRTVIIVSKLIIWKNLRTNE